MRVIPNSVFPPYAIKKDCSIKLKLTKSQKINILRSLLSDIK